MRHVNDMLGGGHTSTCFTTTFDFKQGIQICMSRVIMLSAAQTLDYVNTG